MGNAGLSFYENYSPKKNSEIFWRQALLGVERIYRRNRPSFLPHKALRNPRKSPQALKWVQSLYRTQISHQITLFCTGSPWHSEALVPSVPLPFHPKYPVFQHFLDCVLAQPRDFRDQIPDFARLSCIGNGLSKNMARILRGVKSPFASSAGGGGLFSFLPSFGPSLGRSPLQAVSLSPCGASLHGFLDGCNFWPFLASVLACIALSLCRWGFVLPWGFRGLVGLSAVVILFACVPCPPAKGKKPFCPCFLPCLPALSRLYLCRACRVCPCVVSSWEGTKEKRPFVWVVSPWVVVFGFSY